MLQCFLIIKWSQTTFYEGMWTSLGLQSKMMPCHAEVRLYVTSGMPNSPVYELAKVAGPVALSFRSPEATTLDFFIRICKGYVVLCDGDRI